MRDGDFRLVLRYFTVCIRLWDVLVRQIVDPDIKI